MRRGHVESATRVRRAMRLHGYDYASAGAYFVTICTAQRECLFGYVCGGQVELSPAGMAVLSAWLALPDRFPLVALDEYTIMPNHVHAIVVLEAGYSAQDLRTQQAASLPEVMRAFKSISAIAANRVLRREGVPLWQERYYDRIVRDEEELDRIRQYIRDNPMAWADDEHNPDRSAPV